MSFGFSVGDFIATAVLIKDIISALNASSTSEYRELMLELYGLQRALDEIEHLQCTENNEVAINAVKVTALMCQHPLNEFESKMKKFDSLGEGVRTSAKSRAKLYTLKLRWGFAMADEVQKLRAYLIAHVGSLNIRLTTLSLNSSSDIVARIEERHEGLLKAMGESHDAAEILAQETKSQKQLTLATQSWLQSFANLVNSAILPQLGALVDLVGKVWVANMQIMDILVKQQVSGKPPDVQHTWFQIPVRFEDALGRVIPIPSEYNWSKVNAIVLDQFKDGPGHEKVLRGEFDVFNTKDSTQIITGSESRGLVPGMSLTMAFIIGLYMHQPLPQCPRPGCRTSTFTRLEGGGKTCSSCNVWFDVSQKALPRPFRMKHTEDIFRKVRSERKWFKNVRLVPSEVPSLPPVADALGFWVKGGPSVPLPRELRTDSKILLSAAKVQVAPEIARKAIEIVAEDSGFDLCELRGFTDSIDLDCDSLLSLVIGNDLLNLGLQIPKNRFGNTVMGKELGQFLKAFISEHGHLLDGC